MKKILFAILFSLASLIGFCCMKSITAEATDAEFSVNSRVVLASEVNAYNQILTDFHHEGEGSNINPLHDFVQAGDMIVTVSLANNPGFSGSGVGVYYDYANYDVLLAYDDDSGYGVAAFPGDNMQNLSFSMLVNTTKHRVGITTSGTQNATQDGEYVSFFLRAKTNATDLTHPITGIKVLQFCNKKNTDLDYEIETQTQCEYIPYILGDLNGDGVVNTNDSNYLMSAISNGDITRATLANQFVGMAGMYYHNQVIFEVADVNSDNVINQTDANLILTYYNYILLEVNYNGPIGTQLYITVTYNITIVT